MKWQPPEGAGGLRKTDMTLTPTTWPEPWHSRLRDCEGIAEIDATVALLQAQYPKCFRLQTDPIHQWADALDVPNGVQQ
jgi:hypothetical protein